MPPRAIRVKKKEIELNSELIINSTPQEVTIALVEDKVLVELNSEKKDQRFSVGDIYLGRVKKLIPSLNAAFVDVGHEKDAFLHYLDLGPQVQSLQKLIKQATTGKRPDASLADFHLEKDIEYCLELNTCNVVPKLIGGAIKNVVKETAC